MPALAMYEITPPTDEREFENMLVDYGRMVWGGVTSSRLGQRGQKQHGIDVLVTRQDGSCLCIQCKDYIKTQIKEHDIDEWVKKAEESPIPFSFFVIATASRLDAAIQEYVAKKSADRQKVGKFPVAIIFWEDIEHFIKLHPELIRIYYPYLYRRMEYTNNLIIKIHDDRRDAMMKKEITEEDVRIVSEDLLQSKFLDEIVRYRITDLLQVDPFVGFEFDLILASDCFSASVQELLNRAIGIESSERYIQIIEFCRAVDMFNSFLGMICQVSYDGRIAKATNELESTQSNYYEVARLRKTALEALKIIKN